MSLEILLTPPLAFVLYVALVAILNRFGRLLAGPGHASALKSSTYASGEAAPTRPAAPGYRPFFVIALFFAILHLGILIVASGTFTPITGIYICGLLVALIALIVG
jgi:NADH:ubiquinone oxidoreductase subunit 3 (subunit A)